MSRPIPPSIRCFLLIGTRFDTITHVAWSNNKPTVVETPDSGDGTVSFQEKGGNGHGASVLTANGVEYRDNSEPPTAIDGTGQCVTGRA